jgi:hypothetical protein
VRTIQWLRLSAISAVFFVSQPIFSQSVSPVQNLASFTGRAFRTLNKKAANLQDKLNKNQENYLARLERLEKRLKRKISKGDSLLAENVFGDIGKTYTEFRNPVTNTGEENLVYCGHLDSLSTALQFLKDDSLPAFAANFELKQTLARYRMLQSQLNSSNLLAKQLTLREGAMTAQLEKIGMIKQLRKFREQCYYYKAQLAAYKNSFEDPARLERKLLDLVSCNPKFKDFFANNSLLQKLFVLPGSQAAVTQTFPGLQTRANLTFAITNRFGSVADVSAMLRQSFQSAEQQLAELKNRFSSWSSGNYSNGDANGDIRGFKPNSQKTKSFLKRLEYGIDLQSQKARYYFPVTTDIGLSLGYRINDRSSIGFGASYKVGWGRGWDAIVITHQGIGLRSYVDFKIKASYYLSGGYEQNYYNITHTIDQLRKELTWKKSGLIGISKRFDAGPRLKGDIKILWDFLSYQRTPKTQALVFRIGYKIK